jgi:uroporphyrinogen decarboxylase
MRYAAEQIENCLSIRRISPVIPWPLFHISNWPFLNLLMNSFTSIQHVSQVVSRSQGIPIAKGELVMDRQFIRELLAWKGDGPIVDGLDHVDLLIEGCRTLNLDLVCLQSDQAINKPSDQIIKYESIQRFKDEDLFVFWIVDGVFQSVVRRHGLMAVLSMMGDSLDVLAAEFISTSEQVVISMNQAVDAGAHGIILADDIAYGQGTYMSPDFIERYLQPAWKAQTAKANELGVPVFFHSDGNLNKILPNIIAAGFDGLQCIEPAAGMDIIEISNQYGQSLCLMGGIDPALLVHNENLCDIETAGNNLRRTVTTLMETGQSNGGLIIGSCSGLYADMSPELVHYMYQLVSEFNSG